MEQTIEMRIPDQWLEGISTEPLTLQQIFRLGLHQYKVERALALYHDGVGSLGYIAERLGLSKRDLIHEARTRGIEPAFSERTVQEELGQWPVQS
jgi:predicted HTH domain antitoxin